MDWIRDINIKDLLNNDTMLIYEHCGLDVLLKLWECLPGLNIYISTRPLMEAKKRYINMNYRGNNVKELALKLKVSERFVQDVVGRQQSSRAVER